MGFNCGQRQTLSAQKGDKKQRLLAGHRKTGKTEGMCKFEVAVPASCVYLSCGGG